MCVSARGFHYRHNVLCHEIIDKSLKAKLRRINLDGLIESSVQFLLQILQIT